MQKYSSQTSPLRCDSFAHPHPLNEDHFQVGHVTMANHPLWLLRNSDWRNEESIFLSGIKVNTRNAKLYNNVGHALESQKKFDQALVLFMEAAKVSW